MPPGLSTISNLKEALCAFKVTLVTNCHQSGKGQFSFWPIRCLSKPYAICLPRLSRAYTGASLSNFDWFVAVTAGVLTGFFVTLAKQ